MNNEEILDSLLAKVGCSRDDIEPIKTIARSALTKVSLVLKTDPIHLTLWSKQAILSYSIGQWTFYASSTDEKVHQEMIDNPNLTEMLSIIVANKFLLINMREDDRTNSLSPFSPVSSTVEAVLNLMNSYNSRFVKYNPNESLIFDLFDRIIKEACGIIKMLNLGLANDAYGSWRTLHEAECVIKILLQGGQNLQNVYLKHIVYNNAFREAIDDEEMTNNIFAQMKSEMKEHDLKSKDMKKYIEYGWLYSSDLFINDDPNYKLNFRDGVQKCAGLSKYTMWYEAASELSHSSPVFFYSNNEYFKELTTIGLYDVVERIEHQFYEYLKNYITLSDSDNMVVRLMRGDMERIGKKLRRGFTEKYKDADLYDQKDI